MTRPRVLVVADVPGWAWDRKARQIKKHLDGRAFDVEVCYHAKRVPVEESFDLYHTFEVYQFEATRALFPKDFVATTGITAHVWQTWESHHGAGTVARWASLAREVHANSVLLKDEFEALLGRRVWYVPNGVDEQFFRRERSRSSDRLVVGFVGKPNPRKGHYVVWEACRRAGVELREVRRKSQDALSAEEMREFYQDIHVLAVASDMDGTPNPALEAAACECAVLSNRIGNMPEFIRHGENGLFVEREVDSFVAALADLARDVDRVVEMGRAARVTVEAEWTWEKMSENYAKMWRAALGGDQVVAAAGA